METIIGLLFILLPVIFKLIGRNLEKSGQPEKAGKVRDLAKTLGTEGDSEKDPFEEWLKSLSEEATEPEQSQVLPQPQLQQPQPQPLPQQVKVDSQLQMPREEVKRTTVRPVLQEEKTEKKKDKIDPKKLVIYSEIMKPKYK